MLCLFDCLVAYLKAASHISPCLILMKSFTQSLDPNMLMDFFPFLFVFSVHFRTYPSTLYMLDWSSYTQFETALIQCSKYSSHSASRSGILYFRQMFLQIPIITNRSKSTSIDIRDVNHCIHVALLHPAKQHSFEYITDDGQKEIDLL